jgi:hypothetical protein
MRFTENKNDSQKIPRDMDKKCSFLCVISCGWVTKKLNFMQIPQRLKKYLYDCPLKKSNGQKREESIEIFYFMIALAQVLGF